MNAARPAPTSLREAYDFGVLDGRESARKGEDFHTAPADPFQRISYNTGFNAGWDEITDNPEGI